MTRLLYVEDNDDNVYMLKMRLELLDEFEVLVAEDGEKGCAAALEHKPELILMDLDLPVVDGWEATRRLKSDPRTRHIPVIALSAHALAGAREKAIEAGCDEFDTKPVEFERLLGKIRQVEIHQDQVRLVLERRRAALFAVHRDQHLEFIQQLEPHLEHVDVVVVVFDVEKSGHDTAFAAAGAPSLATRRRMRAMSSEG